MEASTWFQLSKAPVGARVRFAEPWDIFSEGLIVPAGSTGTIVEQGLNDIWCALAVRPDDEALANSLNYWNRAVILHGPEGDSDPEENSNWWKQSPLEVVRSLYYVTHTDEYGERHQIGDAFEAKSATDALFTLLEQAGAEDDGRYEVFDAEVVR